MRFLPRLTILCLWLIALCANMVPLKAGDKFLEGESLGKLALGQKSDQVTSFVGKPDSKGKDTMWEAIGEWVQEWRFKAQGLTFNMASESKGGAKTIASVTAVSPCKLTTARGIQIGSSIADVTKAYKKFQDKEMSVPGKTFVAGSIYGGVIFTFKDGKVSQIFLGAAAE